jgi:hypothetical protein
VPCLRYLPLQYNLHQLIQVHLHISCVSILSTATFSRPFSCTFSYIHAYIQLWTHSDVSILHLHSSVDVQWSLQCYSYISAAIFVYIFVHPRLHSSVDAQRRIYSTPTLICGCTAVSTVLQLHFRTSTPTLICGRTATSLFHTYTHLWMYSGLYSATATFSRPFSCTLRLHSSVDAHVCVAFTLRFSGPSLALFSRWQRVHGYTSLIRPRFHSSLHSTSTFSEHFRDPGVYIRSTFYIDILRTFSYI